VCHDRFELEEKTDDDALASLMVIEMNQEK
jgi:hypothetical protein